MLTSMRAHESDVCGVYSFASTLSLKEYDEEFFTGI
jgi:hypothetical protein